MCLWFYQHQHNSNSSIPLLVANGAALLEWKPMDWTQPCMVGCGEGGEEGGVGARGQTARMWEGGGVLCFVKLMCWKQPKLCSLRPPFPLVLPPSLCSFLPALYLLSSLHLLSVCHWPVSGRQRPLSVSRLTARVCSRAPPFKKVSNKTPWKKHNKNHDKRIKSISI